MKTLVGGLLPEGVREQPALAHQIARWGLLGLLLRLAVIPFTLHSDLLVIYAFPSLLAFHGVFDLYSYLREHVFAAVNPQGGFFYPPLTYYTFALFQFLFQPFVPGFSLWMENFLELQARGGATLAHYLALPGAELLYLSIFFMKLPYLIFDFATAFLLLRLVERPEQASALFKLWMFNPVVLYGVFLVGQFEVIPTFFLVACLYWAQRGRPRAAMVALGVAAAFKNIPLLMLPFAAALLGRGLVQRGLLLGVGIAPYLLFFVPLYISSDGFVQHSLISARVAGVFAATAGSLGTLWRVGAGLAYLLLLAYALWRVREDRAPALLRPLLLIPLLLFLSAWPISPHYFVWATPFLAWQVALRPGFWKLAALAVLALFLTTMVNQQLWAGLFSPIDPVLFGSLPAPAVLFQDLLPPDLLVKGTVWLFRLALLAVILALGWELLLREKVDALRSKVAPV